MIDDQRTCVGFLHVLFCFQFRACAASVLLRLEKPVSSEVLLGSTRQKLSSAGGSILQLADISSPVPLLHCVLFQYDGVGSFGLFTGDDSQPTAPIFVGGLLESWSLFRPKIAIFAGILERCPLLASIPRPVNILDSPCASWASPFFSASLSCSLIRFLSGSCLLFATHRLIEKRQICSVSLSFILRFCSGHLPFVVAPLLFVRLVSFIPPLR